MTNQTINPGSRLFSTVCTTEMIAVKAPPDIGVVTIGGAPVAFAACEADGEVAAGHDGGSAMGKRYVDDSGRVEFLCTKPGDGVPAVDGQVLAIREAKPLPASD